MVPLPQLEARDSERGESVEAPLIHPRVEDRESRGIEEPGVRRLEPGEYLALRPGQVIDIKALLSELILAGPSLPRPSDPHQSTMETLETFRVLRELQTLYGPDACSTYIISMATEPAAANHHFVPRRHITAPAKANVLAEKPIHSMATT